MQPLPDLRSNVRHDLGANTQCEILPCASLVLDVDFSFVIDLEREHRSGARPVYCWWWRKWRVETVWRIVWNSGNVWV